MHAQMAGGQGPGLRDRVLGAPRAGGQLSLSFYSPISISSIYLILFHSLHSLLAGGPIVRIFLEESEKRGTWRRQAKYYLKATTPLFWREMGGRTQAVRRSGPIRT